MNEFVSHGGPTAIGSWTDALWGRTGYHFRGAEGCFFWFIFWPVMLVWIAVKASVWLAGIVVVLLAMAIVAAFDLARRGRSKVSKKSE